jgi:zinc transport system substrate-binding protein
LNRFGSIKLLVAIFLVALAVSGCSRQKQESHPGRLKVVTTLFPLYDFARNIGKDSVDVSLILPPGVEPHSFEPKPEDILSSANADIFIYTSREMEPWAEKLLKGVVKGDKPALVEAGRRCRYIAAPENTGHHGHEEEIHGARDPHIWLDINNAMIMVDNIAEALSNRLPDKREFFAANAAAYKKRLQDLEGRFDSGLSACATRKLVHGGHFAFAYLADRYKLEYISAYGISADSEPSPRKVMELVNIVRQNGVKGIFYEELLSPGIAKAVSEETGAALLKLHGIHNLTLQEFEKGTTYLDLMEQNLAALRKGLECR